MIKNSFLFWTYYKKQTALIISIFLVSTIVLLNVLLFIRGNKMTQYEDVLDVNGNYDYCFVDFTEQQYGSMSESGFFQSLETVYFEGNIVLNEQKQFSLASGSDDALNMLHYSLQKGRYPAETNEIAITEDTCKQLGVYPKIGATLTVKVEQEQEREVSFTIVGILKPIERMWYSTSFFNPYPDALVGPSDSKQKLMAMGTTKTDANADDVDDWLNSNGIKFERTDGKMMLDAAMVKSEVADNEMVKKAKEQYHLNDFETVILIPLFAIIITILSFVAVLYSAISILQRRKESLALYCLLGMELRTARWIIVLEMISLALFSCGVGLGVGTGLYQLIVWILNSGLNVNVVSAFASNEVVRLVTLNPYLMTIVFVLASSALSIVWVVLDWCDIRANDVVRQKVRGIKHISLKQNYARLFRAGRQKNTVNCLILVLLFSTVYFSAILLQYKYDAVVSEYETQIEESNMGTYDYTATRDFKKALFGNWCMNRRKMGFSEKAIEQFEECLGSDNVDAAIQVRSTKILETAKDSKLPDKIKVAEWTMEELDELVEKINIYNGYTTNEYEELYNVPIVAMDEEKINIKNMDAELVDGAVNMDKLKSGEEVLLAVVGSDNEIPYKVGDTLTMTDVLLDEDEEAYDYDFSTDILPSGGSEEFSYTPGGIGSEAVIDGCKAFGKRYDFTVKIGGIIVLDKESFWTCSTMKDERAPYELIADVDALAVFGLDECNYNKVGCQLPNARVIDEFEELWYNTYKDSEDMNLRSVSEIKSAIYKEALKYNCVIVLLAVFLVLLGLLAIYHCIQLQILEKREQIGIVRMLGVEKQNISGIYMKRYLKYLAIEVSLQWIPLLLDWLRKQYIVKTSLMLVERYNLYTDETTPTLGGMNP